MLSSNRSPRRQIHVATASLLVIFLACLLQSCAQGDSPDATATALATSTKTPTLVATAKARKKPIGTAVPKVTPKSNATPHLRSTTKPAATATRRPKATATPAMGANAGPTSMAGVTVANLPPEAQHTVKLIQQGGPFPYARDGVDFQNREGLLPRQARSYYHEYTVITPGSADRGARRIIAGTNGELYYTDDHYASFSWIEQ